ncbi:Matrixin family protein [Acanthocheilonema viteae]
MICRWNESRLDKRHISITSSLIAFTAGPLMLSLSLLSLTLALSSSAIILDSIINAKSTSYKDRRICDRVAPGFVQPRLKKRYVLNKNKWYTGTLSWSFRDPFHLFKNDQKFAIVKNILRQAFEKWSNSSRGALIFKDLSPMDRTKGNIGANFDILFAKYAHGDKESFDGFGGIVAHSGYPVEGIIHFDGSEHWSIDGRTGLDLRYVALHEIGHALGLRHSNDPKAIMNPYYSDQLKEGFELGEDDILAMIDDE